MLIQNFHIMNTYFTVYTYGFELVSSREDLLLLCDRTSLLRGF